MFNLATIGPISQWTKEQVGDWIENEMKLPELKGIFFNRGITGEHLVLFLMPENDPELQRLVPDLLQRMKIRNNIKAKQGNSHIQIHNFPMDISTPTMVEPFDFFNVTTQHSL
jgi:hypothetical protein